MYIFINLKLLFEIELSAAVFAEFASVLVFFNVLLYVFLYTKMVYYTWSADDRCHLGMALFYIRSLLVSGLPFRLHTAVGNGRCTI